MAWCHLLALNRDGLTALKELTFEESVKGKQKKTLHYFGVIDYHTFYVDGFVKNGEKFKYKDELLLQPAEQRGQQRDVQHLPDQLHLC
jgi:hypothetical protein